MNAACGSPTENTFPDTTDAAALDETIVDDAPTLPSGDASDATPNCVQCSGDLKSILTCGDNPQLVQTCTGDLGCGAGGCVPACDAAAANKSSIGCDYYAIPPDAWTHKSCFAAYVNNTWDVPLKVSLVWKGKTIDATPFSYVPKGSGNAITYQQTPSTGIAPNSMAIVFLNQVQSADGYHVACPNGTKAAIESEDVEPNGTSLANALELKTSVPAVVYDIYPFGGASSYMPSATLLLPTTAWDTNYVTTTMSEWNAGNSIPGIDFVGMQDNTTVTLLPTTDITAANGVAGAKKGVPITYKVNKGQLLHLMQAVDGAGNDLTGSVVQSSNPIGVWGEHFCMTHTPSPPNWRIVGAAKGTTLTYDPPVPGAPKTLTLGQLVEFPGPEAFRIQSQDSMHPFYLAAHRPGGDCDAAHQQIPPIQALDYDYTAVANETANYSMGGPETVNIVPPAQFLSTYVFFTDPTFGWTDLAMVRKKAGDGTYKDVTLDCLGKVPGWKQIGGSPYQYAHVSVQTGHQPVGKCDNGLHTVKSDAPFGITVWGYDSAASYAYPAGASVKPINTIVVPPVPN